MRRRPRAFMLILVLFLLLILLTMGLAFLGTRVAQYRASVLSVEEAQARAVARAGMEDARAKLEMDLDFPPRGAEDQLVFTYSEDVTDVSGTLVGSYTVTIDVRWRREPYQVLRITSEGQVGPRDEPFARSVLRAHLDLLDTDPTTHFRYLRWEDEGSL